MTVETAHEKQNTVDSWLKAIQLLNNLDKARLENDLVNNPEHYQASNGMEAIEVIDSFGLNFNLGNAIKYILRSSKKGKPTEDLQKAIWYLKRERCALEREDEDDEG